MVVFEIFWRQPFNRFTAVVSLPSHCVFSPYILVRVSSILRDNGEVNCAQMARLERHYHRTEQTRTLVSHCHTSSPSIFFIKFFLPKMSRATYVWFILLLQISLIIYVVSNISFNKSKKVSTAVLKYKRQIRLNNYRWKWTKFSPNLLNWSRSGMDKVAGKI